MAAKIVERATMPPAKCAVTGDIDGPFIDTGTRCDQAAPYIYLHVPVVEFYARELLDMVPRSEVEALREQVEAYGEELEKLREFAKAHESFERTLEEVAA